GGMGREASRLARVLVQRVAKSAELLRQRQLQIAGRFELVEILLTELVVAIVARGALPAGLKERIRENRAGRHSHEATFPGVYLSRERIIRSMAPGVKGFGGATMARNG